MKQLAIILIVSCLSLQSLSQIKLPSKAWANTALNVEPVQFSKMLVSGVNETYVISNRINSNGNSDIAIAQYDDHGNALWEFISTIGPVYDDYGTALASHPGGGIVGLGYVAASEMSGYTYVFRMDASGQCQ